MTAAYDFGLQLGAQLLKQAASGLTGGTKIVLSKRTNGPAPNQTTAVAPPRVAPAPAPPVNQTRPVA